MRRPGTAQRGFTLLEVLIAVVVLAFGLLGVVAVFPAVIDVQRRAQDAVLGGSLAASAEALIESSVLDSQTLDWHDWDSESAPGVRRFPAREVLSNDVTISAIGAPVGPPDQQIVRLDFLWDELPFEADGTLVLGGEEAAVPFLFNNALLTIPRPGPQQLPTIEFPVSQRLLPDEASGAAPRYVWDMLVRRVDIGIGLDVSTGSEPPRSRVEVPISRLPEFPIEVMVIVRPVDRGIRVPVGLTLRDTLRGFRFATEAGGSLARDLLENRDRRFPVAVSATDLATLQPGAGLDTTSRYSLPLLGRRVGTQPTVNDPPLASFEFGVVPKQVDFRQRRPTDPPVIVNTRNAERAMSQVGQLFVSDRGIVHRVTRVSTDAEDDGIVRVEFEPPMPPGWRQIVFTPQVPADIRVIRTR